MVTGWTSTSQAGSTESTKSRACEGMPTLIVVDGKLLAKDRNVVLRRLGNNVYLTGFVDPRYCILAMDRATGSVVSMPDQDSKGEIIGGHKAFEMTVSRTEAKRFMRLSNQTGPLESRGADRAPSEARGSQDPAPD